MSKRLYKISEGSVCECSVDTQVDDDGRSVLAYARTESDALQLAARYDARQIDVGNIFVDGEVVVALCDYSE